MYVYIHTFVAYIQARITFLAQIDVAMTDIMNWTRYIGMSLIFICITVAKVSVFEFSNEMCHDVHLSSFDMWIFLYIGRFRSEVKLSWITVCVTWYYSGHIMAIVFEVSQCNKPNVEQKKESYQGVHGCHAYHSEWEPAVGEEVECRKERFNFDCPTLWLLRRMMQLLATPERIYPGCPGSS